MIEPHAALAVFTTMLVICLIPAADTTLAIVQSTLYGYRAGMAVALRVALGMMIDVVDVAFGTAALIQASPWLFLALKIVGAGYLLYLVGTLLTAAPVILFALLSPFVDAERANVAWQLMQVGFFCHPGAAAGLLRLQAAARWLRSERAHRLLGQVGAVQACAASCPIACAIQEGRVKSAFPFRAGKGAMQRYKRYIGMCRSDPDQPRTASPAGHVPRANIQRGAPRHGRMPNLCGRLLHSAVVPP